VAATVDIEKQLAWERRQRPRAGVAAIVGALAFIAYLGLTQALLSSLPKASFMESLQRALDPGPLARETSLQVPIHQYVHDHAALVLGSGAAALLSFLGLAWALGFLAAATVPRNPALPRWVVLLPLVGGLLKGLGLLLRQIGSLANSSSFLDGPHTVAEATSRDGLTTFAILVDLLGSVALAAALVLVSLNAMRTGLLTRFYGVLGMLTGATLVLIPLPIVQIFWLASLGLLFFGLSPGGMPPAWSSGQAEPWPSSRPPRARAAPPPEPASDPQPVVRSSSRGKRKKR
jgi:hypothetical protein